ncbi:unnamed protein product [Effrenium voratum]|nr:unnamed protein product [Effrenium voratum]
MSLLAEQRCGCSPVDSCSSQCFKATWGRRIRRARESERRKPASDIRDGRIFVSVVAYCDSELPVTLCALLAQCVRPELITVGVVWQGEGRVPLNEPELRSLWLCEGGEVHSRRWHLPQSREVESEAFLDGRLRVISMRPEDARGPCWARYLAQLLWEGEELYLQLDSHMRFVPGWDQKARQQLELCALRSPKPVLCSYGRGYELGTAYNMYPGNLTGCLNCAAFFDKDDILNIRYRSLTQDWQEPQSSFFWSAHFSFSSSQVLAEVPYDPQLLMLFFGEEILMTVRLFTHGWDLFSPSEGLFFHLWKRDYRRVYAEDMSELYQELGRKSRRRLHSLLGSGPTPFFQEPQQAWPLPGPPLQDLLVDPFGLGTKRSLQAYESAAGVCFRERRISDRALRGGAAEECFLAQEEGGQAAVEKQCLQEMQKLQETAKPSDAWASAASAVSLQMNVTCAPKAGGDGSGSSGVCGDARRANRCARFVLDGVIPSEEVEELRSLLTWLVAEAWGGGSGPPSVVDLHSETISYKEQFVNLSALMEFKSISFTEKQVEAYLSVRRRLRDQISQLFGVPVEGLRHDMTFFSHINGSKKAQTVHDEYWHSHVDTEQYGTFAYTTLLYLNTANKDFQGGQFLFEGTGGADAVVEPRYGRLVAFSSDAENPHKVLPVSSGVRMALTSAFTCSQKEIEAFPKPG